MQPFIDMLRTLGPPVQSWYFYPQGICTLERLVVVPKKTLGEVSKVVLVASVGVLTTLHPPFLTAVPLGTNRSL